jgi:hypothetical protein
MRTLLLPFPELGPVASPDVEDALAEAEAAVREQPLLHAELERWVVQSTFLFA